MSRYGLHRLVTHRAGQPQNEVPRRLRWFANHQDGTPPNPDSIDHRHHDHQNYVARHHAMHWRRDEENGRTA